MTCSCGSEWDENGICKNKCKVEVFKEHMCSTCGMHVICIECGTCVNCQDSFVNHCCIPAEKTFDLMLKNAVN